jgi:hypothetical protein
VQFLHIYVRLDLLDQFTDSNGEVKDGLGKGSGVLACEEVIDVRNAFLQST